MTSAKHFPALSIVRPIVRSRGFDAASKRKQSTFSATSPIVKHGRRVTEGDRTSDLKRSSGLERLPTSSLLRNVFLGLFITTPAAFRPGFAVMKKIANSKSAIFNPDANPLLRMLIKPLIYDQFCAGRDKAEICQTKSKVRDMGYSGVILGYGKEIIVTPSNRTSLRSKGSASDTRDIDEWEKGNLRTLDMIGDGDWLAVKFTGAGASVTGALIRNEDPPARFQDAMEELCAKAKSKNCRILIDAEQSIVQGSIDRLAINLMRKYNSVDGNALVYNTIQAYLKASRENLKTQLALASREGWTLGVKLVRGAYINSDTRSLIHDTKADTDDSYNSIVRDLLTGSNLGLSNDTLPNVRLFLAGHNPESIAAAMDLIRTQQNRLKVIPDFGQLQGMGDDLGCKVLRQNEEHRRSLSAGSAEILVPKIYKYVTWGTVQECMQYLIRRVVENRGGTDRMRDGLSAYLQELKRRLLWR